MVGSPSRRFDFEEPALAQERFDLGEPALAQDSSCASPDVSTSRVIIFDWDDTLCPSSWVDRSKLMQIESFSALPGLLQARFTILEELVGRCLYAAAKLGNVIVITNALLGGHASLAARLGSSPKRPTLGAARRARAFGRSASLAAGLRSAPTHL